MVSTAGAMRCKPAGETDWKVIRFKKLSRDTPPYARAEPFVGRVWFTPDA
jgi:hypothetical protein